MGVFICDCGKPAPTQRERRVDNCLSHADSVHVFVQREEMWDGPYACLGCDGLRIVNEEGYCTSCASITL